MSIRRPPTALALTLVVALALLLRLYRLDGQCFWIDEVYQVSVAALPLPDLIRGFSLRADGGPLSLLLTHVVLSPSNPEWSARLPSALFGTLGIVAIFLAGRALLPEPVPLLAAVLLASSPLHIWYSQDARWYAQWVPTVTLSYSALIAALRTRRAAWWLAFCVLTLLAAYTFVLHVFVLGAQLVSAAWLLRVRGELGSGPIDRRLVILGVLGAIAVAPIAWLILSHTGATTGTPGRPTPLAALPYTVFAYTAGFSLGPTLEYLHSNPSTWGVIAAHPAVVPALLIVTPVLLWGLLALRRHGEACAALAPWLFAPPVLVFVLASFSGVSYNVRYTLAALPAFVLVLALGLHSITPRTLRVVLTAALFGCFAVADWNHFFDPRFAKEDVRGALVAIRRAGGPAPPVVALGQIGIAAHYYGGGLPVVAIGNCEGSAAVDRIRNAGFGEAETLWVMIGRDFEGRAGPCLVQLDRDFSTVREERFSGLALRRLERRRV